MKTRDSGMPSEDYWTTFFDPETILRALGLDSASGRVIDIGSGYGTFTLPVARLTGADVVAIDIERELVDAVVEKARGLGLGRVSGAARDVAANGIGEADGSADVVLLFNLLHCEDPVALLRESWRVLRVGGRIGAIHWRSDVPTPRGPELAIRPLPEAVVHWLVDTGFVIHVPPRVLPPYHFGLVGLKPH